MMIKRFGKGVLGAIVALVMMVAFAPAAHAASYSIEDLKNVRGYWVNLVEDPSWNTKHYFDNFDYRNAGPYTMPANTSTTDIHWGMGPIPSGWTVEMVAADTGNSLTVTSPDGSYKMTYRAVHADPTTPDSTGLSSLKVTANGQALSFIPSQSEYRVSGEVVITNLPANWSTRIIAQQISFYDANKLWVGDYYFYGASKITVRSASDPQWPSTDKDSLGRSPVYRLYNPNNGEHLYTMDLNEYKAIVPKGWRGEGIAFYAWPKDGTTGYQVYRVYNKFSGRHHLTASKGERDGLVRMGWRDEGVAFRYRDTDETVYRAYNPHTSDHLWTLSKPELDNAVRAGWRDEGIAYGRGANN
ncbi:hypothetical protein [Bifidobacterium oedipodis]|uniref:RCC1 repeat-containing protein n=1 Tax=Bifidobacterium oedipodis TaxID=2675322 RepID=A0A7Y0HT41_9BIFI|nr:hypothetical protein [Bifidobacterium sp. DSM 109957]NMM94233.1 RCC1 repeat-containing protein [Bifidobacterium sp. DSM 109957]